MTKTTKTPEAKQAEREAFEASLPIWLEEAEENLRDEFEATTLPNALDEIESDLWEAFEHDDEVADEEDNEEEEELAEQD